MKIVRLYALALTVVALGCNKAASSAPDGNPEPPTRRSPTAPTLAEATFDVRGMTASCCEAVIKVAVEQLPGVREVRVSHAEGRAWVSYDPAKTTPTAIGQAITSTGYEATPASAAPTR